jgi:hypothetical protein
MRLMLALAALLVTTSASAQVYVHGYTTKSGTYVAPHYRSSPDSSKLNNWSTHGNVNPYTGQLGTRSPYSSSPSTSSYGSTSRSGYGSSGSGSSGYGSYGYSPYGYSGQSDDSDSDPE